MAASVPSPSSSPAITLPASSPAPVSSNPNGTPADTSATSTPPPAPAPAPRPTPPPPSPVLAASPPPASPPLPPKPSPSAPPPQAASAPPPSSNSPSPPLPKPPTHSPAPPTAQAPRPPTTPAAPPTAQSPSPASPPSGGPTHTPPPALPSPPASHHKPSLPTPATAADPANPNGGRNPSSNKSSSPGARRGSSFVGNGLSAGVVIGVGVVLAILVLSMIGVAIWYTKKRNSRREGIGYHAGFMSPTSPNSSQQPSGDSANAASSFDPSIQTNYSAGSPRLKACLSDISMGNSLHFTYEELYQITDGFSAQKLLGEGGFGSVYKGRLPDGKEVAVKQLKDGGGQGEREFHAEVEIISRVHHRHLVSLVGYCISNNQRLLVYDYVPNNTLHYHLHGHGRPVLDWSARVKIAAGAARGMAYLHEDCHPRIIHRDIKSSNILLDNNFEAQVGDFGLARLALDAVTHVTTRVMGTFGYMAPEYASSGKLTERSDVFSFGVVLLELITGRKPVDASRPLGDESLVEWARPLLTRALETGNLEELVDPRLEKNFNEVEMFRMIGAAAACVRHSASRRPRMSQITQLELSCAPCPRPGPLAALAAASDVGFAADECPAIEISAPRASITMELQVVRVLDSLADIDLTNGVQPGQSELFNVANTAEVRMFQQMVLGNQDDCSDFSQYSWSSHSKGTDAFSSSRIL